MFEKSFKVGSYIEIVPAHFVKQNLIYTYDNYIRIYEIAS